MSENSRIEWTDHTFNPWIGCTRVSLGCDYCYAAVSTPARAMKVAWGASEPRYRTAASTCEDPIKWNDRHDAFFAVHGRRQRVFCASLADVFDNAVNPAWRADLFELIAKTPKLDWLLLTKRIGNVVSMIEEAAEYRRELDRLHEGKLPANVWLGATIVNQAEADRDIPKLLRTPAHVKFLSMEPLLGAVDISDWLVPSAFHCATGFRQGTGMEAGYCGTCAGHAEDPIHDPECHDFIDWVIAGGESGPRARPTHPDWIRSLRDQCAAAHTPFLFKQWGEWRSVPDSLHEQRDAARADGWISISGVFHDSNDERQPTQGARNVVRLGKKRAGRMLDGVEHDAFPLPVWGTHG
ncbi:MAG: phage Gp37/Gp68 family protein [Paraburkholderia sp.]|uniref:phage Gp37/Gp68 family protein n=1 Tax=Paraburkholderia sp. TaxID=1926495 RepID=UPI001202B642|nr:phage Gp37/Gp68 family protein [Paraburkholderia sp.]TAM00373.1 MAG: phage Gp37/Gp68 family protein [Paraburkholderia sp.]